MADPMVDQITRLKLKLLEKRLENERDNREGRAESALSTRSFDGQADAMHSALRRKKDLLQRLREQHMLEDLSRPHTWGGTRRHYRSDPFLAAPPPQPPAPIHIYQPAPAPPTVQALPPPPPQPPRIIQQTIPQQPTTIIQQLPQQQPLIAQIPPPQAYPAPRSGSIKEDMVEMMLMQNAQMHQIIMQNMMLKAIPPLAMSSPGGAGHQVPHTPHQGQDSYLSNPILVRSEVKSKGSAIHHHHHYGSAPTAQQQPPIGYPMWPSMMPPVPTAYGGAHLPSIQHVTGPVTLPPLNMQV
ncbi:uncharacterized protein C21orf58 [Osmerus eperlanus]|uniref:uncharacterized protein C21orf58 n=1 Tax=Osmerus eperlanus TaxID=29151 RepID=UPI002E15C7BC